MKHFFLLFLCVSFSALSQDKNQPLVNTQLQITLDSLIAVNDLNSFYYTKNNVFYKKEKEKLTQYNNLQLGELTSANAFNPLKINLFYSDFNTVVILDNRLAEIYKVDFNAQQPFKNVSHITTGFDNTIWIYNQDNQQLELYDYKTNKTRVQTLPINGNIIDITSNYNACWLLTNKYLYKYNYFGSLVEKLPNDGYTSIIEHDETIYLKKGTTLFFLDENTSELKAIKTSKLLINQFFVTNETLYIYNDGTLYQNRLKKE
ncbi:hypothetical protein [Lacinutrix salivirga]